MSKSKTPHQSVTGVGIELSQPQAGQFKKHIHQTNLCLIPNKSKNTQKVQKRKLGAKEIWWQFALQHGFQRTALL